uniref:Peptidase S1 domain-containing protein n=1 Tax=Pseudonaja textilis TaxID=8673 RepID=A0A670YPD0_PSETE
MLPVVSKVWVAFLGWLVASYAFITADGTCMRGGAIKPNVKNTERIINGMDANRGSWPWQVSLQTNSRFHICGGSLINENWVVTAAHCNWRSIIKVITRPDWDSYNLNNDVALLKLSSPVQLNAYISPVRLASPTEVLPQGSKCVTTGWGRNNLNCKWAEKIILQQVVLPLVPVDVCQQKLPKPITSSMLCAGGAGATSCHGDSGGPLVCQKGSSWTLVGIVSWGSPNCNVWTPAVYARVSKFRNWIDQTVARN